MSDSDDPLVTYKSQRILHIEKSRVVRHGLRWFLQLLLVSSFHFAADDAVAKSVVVLVVFVAPHDEHFQEGHLLAKTVIQVFQGLSNSSRGYNWL